MTLACGLLAFAAAASTPNTGPKPWDSADDSASPTAVTAALKCRVTRVLEDRTLEIWDEAGKSHHLIRIAETVDLRARKKADFGGRRQLEFSDLQVGHRLKVTYLAGDGRIVRVRVLGTDSAG